MFLRYRVDIWNQKSYMLDNQKKKEKIKKKIKYLFPGSSQILMKYYT